MKGEGGNKGERAVAVEANVRLKNGMNLLSAAFVLFLAVFVLVHDTHRVRDAATLTIACMIKSWQRGSRRRKNGNLCFRLSYSLYANSFFWRSIALNLQCFLARILHNLFPTRIAQDVAVILVMIIILTHYFPQLRWRYKRERSNFKASSLPEPICRKRISAAKSNFLFWHRISINSSFFFQLFPPLTKGDLLGSSRHLFLSHQPITNI